MVRAPPDGGDGHGDQYNGSLGLLMPICAAPESAVSFRSCRPRHCGLLVGFSSPHRIRCWICRNFLNGFVAVSTTTRRSRAWRGPESLAHSWPSSGRAGLPRLTRAPACLAGRAIVIGGMSRERRAPALISS
jgi:hypothetical protein